VAAKKAAYLQARRGRAGVALDQVAVGEDHLAEQVEQEEAGLLLRPARPFVLLAAPSCRSKRLATRREDRFSTCLPAARW
jgi:hypothetical protein